MHYLAQSPAAKEYSQVLPMISTAQQQWETYATLLGSAYKDHEGALKEVEKKLQSQADMAYWVLALLCVSFAGGLAGGLMAPWAASAVGPAATRVYGTVSGTVSGGTGIVTQKVIDESKPQVALATPPGKSPLLFWQDMLGGIGMYASQLRDDISEKMRNLDNDPFRSHQPMQPRSPR